jgi:membrane protease YdiL (CAAX protease family)
MILTSAISFLSATIIGYLCGKLLEDLPFKTLGWVFNRTWLKDFLIGIGLGLLTLCIAVFLTFPMNGITLSLNHADNSQTILNTILTSLAIFFVAAAFEEVLFRGYVFQTFVRANLAWLGILLTSLPFAIVHLGNPNASWISSVNTAIAGVWFGIAYLKTRSLWLAFGIHLGWNWFQGAFFGINVSGLSNIAPNPLFTSKVTENFDWLTGGNYGIEGGITCTIALILSTLFIHFLPILKPTKDMLALTNQENPRK